MPNKQTNKDKFINLAREKFSDKYDYSLVEYTRNTDITTFKCNIHNITFRQSPKNHMRWNGCPQCTKETILDNRQQNFDDIRHKLPDYEYPKNIVGNNSTISVVCKTHGKFTTTINSLLLGDVCPYCANKPNIPEYVLNRCTATHGYKYDYSRAIYINSTTPFSIVCSIHGEFKQSPILHYNDGCGCPKCSRKKDQKPKKEPAKPVKTSKLVFDFENWKSEATSKHNGKYTYVAYKSGYITILCNIHGQFKQRPNDHLRYSGCKKCVMAAMAIKYQLQYNEFVSRANKIHANNYMYKCDSWIGQNSNVIIKCNTHGEFIQTAKNHLRGQGCPVCQISSGHLELINYIKSINNSIIVNDRSIISPYELDIVIPEHKIAVEYNGMFYHSYNEPETANERMRHLDKLKAANKSGYRLYQFWESEWLQKREIVTSIINNSLSLSSKIHARKCTINNISSKEYASFCNETHLQGVKHCSVRYGLFYESELMCCMSFEKHVKHQWEIIRLCSKLNHVIVGGASKLFTHFLRTHKPDSVMTYADKRISHGNTYLALGFQHIADTRPNYFYVKGDKMFNRITFQKHKLKDRLPLFDSILTESQNMFNNGYRRIWDCGHGKFVFLR